MKREEFVLLTLAKDLDQTAEEMENTVKDILKIRESAEKIGEDVKTIDQTFDLIRETDFLQKYALAKWCENKQVYSFDQEFIDVLITSAIDLELDPEIFKRLPYPTFGVRIGDSYGIIHFDDERLCPGQTFISFNPVMSDKRVNGNLCLGGLSLSLDRDVTWVSVKHLRDAALNEEDGHSPNEYQKDSIRDYAKDDHYMIYVMTQICLYLSTTNAIIHENQAQKKIYRPPFDKPKNKYSEIRMWDCGIRYTKDTVKAIREDYKLVSSPTGKHVRPHWRHAHYQHYWTGSGDNKKLTLKWKEPYFVGQGEVPVVIHIKEELK